jgi:hypothetical protein
VDATKQVSDCDSERCWRFSQRGINTRLLTQDG